MELPRGSRLPHGGGLALRTAACPAGVAWRSPAGHGPAGSEPPLRCTGWDGGLSKQRVGGETAAMTSERERELERGRSSCDEDGERGVP